MKFFHQPRLQRPGAGYAFAQFKATRIASLLFITFSALLGGKTLLAQNLSVLPTNPMPGDRLTVNYNPAGGSLEKQTNVSCMAILFKSLISERIIVPLRKVGSSFVGSLTAPKGSELIAFRFYNGALKDEKSITYQVPFFERGEIVVGARYAQANLLANDQDLSFYGIVKPDFAAAFELLKKERRTAIEDPHQVAITREYYNYWLKTDSVAAKRDLYQYLKNLDNETKTEKSYILSFWLYRILNEQMKSQQQLTDLAKAYPNSMMFFSKRFAEIGSARSGIMMESLFQKLVTDYTYSEESRELVKDFSSSFFRKISKAYGYDQNLPKFYEYLIKDTSNVYKAITANDVASYLSVKDLILADAEKISAESLAFLTLAAKENPLEISADGLKNWISKSKATYGLILLKLKKYSIALTVLKDALDESSAKDIDLETHYGIALAKNKQYAIALPFLEAALKEGNTDLLVDETFKTSYLAVGGTPESYEKERQKLFEIANNNHKFKLKTSMLDEVAPNFSLLDLNGKKVSLSDFKGKTVLIDFWATWCIPCKQSFPGMQKLVEKYKGQNVVFLFVNTLEKNRAHLNAEIMSFLKENGYTFNVVLDKPRKDDAGVFELFSMLNLKSIPTKLVIDKTGKIKFKSIGYLGSDEAVIKELSDEIDEVNK